MLARIFTTCEYGDLNRKRIQRHHREEKLTARRRGGRKRAMGTRRPIEFKLQADQRWSLNFVSDQMVYGRRFRILTVVDNCTRKRVALVSEADDPDLAEWRARSGPVPARLALNARD